MSIIQWQQQDKTISLVVNKPEIRKVHYTDFSVDEKTDSFPTGVFCNPSLNKKQYLLLAKIYHPDVSTLPSQLATEITQVINSTKDGHNKNSYSSNPYQTNQSNQAKSHFSVDDFLSYCRASETWILYRYGMRDWVHNLSSTFIVEQFSKSEVVADVKILVKVTIYREYNRIKFSVVDEYVTGFCRKTLFLKRINWELLNVSELKAIIKKECIPVIVSRYKKAGLIEILTNYFSGMGHYENPGVGNWYFEYRDQLSLLFPDFWDDDKARQDKEEKIKKEKEKRKRDEYSNIPRYDLASWIKLKRVGYIGRDKFIQVLQRADELFSERQHYYDYRNYPLRTDEEWRQAFDEVMKHP